MGGATGVSVCAVGVRGSCGGRREHSLVILREDRNLSDGHPGPLPGTNHHPDALNALGEERAETVGVHLTVLKVLDVFEAFTRGSFGSLHLEEG